MAESQQGVTVSQNPSLSPTKQGLLVEVEAGNPLPVFLLRVLILLVDHADLATTLIDNCFDP